MQQQRNRGGRLAPIFLAAALGGPSLAWGEVPDEPDESSSSDGGDRTPHGAPSSAEVPSAPPVATLDAPETEPPVATDDPPEDDDAVATDDEPEAASSASGSDAPGADPAAGAAEDSEAAPATPAPPPGTDQPEDPAPASPSSGEPEDPAPASPTSGEPEDHAPTSPTSGEPEDPAPTAPSSAQPEAEAEAEAEADDDDELEPEFTPPASFPALPTLLASAPAVYPPAALAAGEEAEVIVTIDLDAEGRVIDAFVAEPVGRGFDEAAVQAIRNFRFSPAWDAEGNRASSRIEFAYRFTLDAVPVVSLEGQVRGAGTRESVAEASVFLEGPEGQQVVLESDAEGTFRAADLAPGTWRISAGASGYDTESAEVEVKADSVAQVTLFLSARRQWETGTASEEITVEATRLRPEVTERRLEAADLRVVPGTNGDIVRAVQSLPGVARTPYNTGQLLVRGTAPADSRFYLGGTELPLVFHFGGFATVISSEALEEVLFLPGGYGVRYGRSLGGVVDLITDTQLPDGGHGLVSIDVFQSSAYVETPFGEDHALSIAGRQSYMHLVLNPLVNIDPATYSVRLPRYGDLQGRWLWRTDGGNTYETMFLWAEDGFSAQFRDDGSETGFQESLITIRQARLWHQADVALGEGWRLEATGAFGPHGTEANYDDDTEAYDRALRTDLRLEVNRPIPEDGVIGWRLGVDLQTSNERLVYDMSAFSDFYTYGGREQASARFRRPAVYAEQSQKAGPVVITPGVRADWVVSDRGYAAQSLDPRVLAEWTVSERTSLRAAAGQYSQFPQLREIDEDSRGNPELGPQHAVQYVLGWGQELSALLRGELTLYHSDLRELIVGHEDRFEFALAPPPQPPFDTGDYANEGTGKVWGAEGLLRLDTPRTFGWVAATLSRSTRTEREGQEPTLYRYDQPLVLTSVVSHQLPRNWRVGGRVRFGSGNPYTPIANRVYDLDSYSWIPIYDAGGSDRMPYHFTLDLRVDKDWPLRTWTFTTYLDLQNATNRKNVELVNWNRDYTEEIAVYGLPVLPTLGFKGTW